MVQIRPFSCPDDYAECVQLQKLTWGQEFTELVPPVILMLTQKVGGIAAGAFDDSGLMTGFVYGLVGYRDGEPFHWSHMLAVRPEFDGRGIGRRLKEYQRDEMLRVGILTIRWTFDPLVARNAHLNFNRLGAVATEYVTDMYGTDTGSLLHSGLGTDRFVVQWHVADSHVEQILAGNPPKPDSSVLNAPTVNSEIHDQEAVPVQPEFPDAPLVRVEVPPDIEQVKAESMDVGRKWRECTRRAFLWYMDRGYIVGGFYRDSGTGRCFYHLNKESRD